jgi:glycosyltransferase involved in cell wall biosynthesis
MDRRIVNVASYNRVDSLIISLKSIYDQCDEINVCLNDHKGVIPDFLQQPKINLTMTDNSKGDAFKFLKLNDSNGYFITIDDDLVYPQGYVEFMVTKCKENDNKKIITLHGRNFNKFPIPSYYNSASEVYHCLKEVKKDVVVQFGGTGVMCFHTSILKKSIDDFIYPNMADVWIGKFAKENKIEIICVAHNSGFITYTSQKTTIYNSEINKDTLQTKIVNEMFGFTKKPELSVVIPAYNCKNHIDDCIMSIIKSGRDNDIEILVGVDGCIDTLNHIKNKNYHNVKYFYFTENKGPYSIKNTLANMSKSDKLLFFDSDDIMNQNMIGLTIKELNNYICVKPKYEEFGDRNKIRKFGEGVFGIGKETFLQMNGFEPWMMAADSDFMGRLYKTKPRILHTEQVLFRRRVHSSSLTNRKDTGMSSPLRAYYANISKNKKGHGNPDKLNVRGYIEITPNGDYIFQTSDVDNIIPTPEPPKEKNSVLKILDRPQVATPQKEAKEINYEEVNKVIYNKQTNKKNQGQGVNNQSAKTLNIKKKLFENIKGGITRESRRI